MDTAAVETELLATLRRLGDGQAGIVSRDQLVELRMSDSWIRARLAAGQWQRVHPGVFATFTGELPRTSRIWTAVLSCGSGAVVADETALELSGMRLDDGRSRNRVIHIAIDQRRKVKPPSGVAVRRVKDLSQLVHPRRSATTGTS